MRREFSAPCFVFRLLCWLENRAPEVAAAVAVERRNRSNPFSQLARRSFETAPENPAGPRFRIHFLGNPICRSATLSSWKNSLKSASRLSMPRGESAPHLTIISEVSPVAPTLAPLRAAFIFFTVVRRDYFSVIVIAAFLRCASAGGCVKSILWVVHAICG